MSAEWEMIRYDSIRHIAAYVSKVHYLKEHMHGSFELDFILDGTARCRRGSETRIVRPGDIVLFNPHEPHGFVAREDNVLTMLSLQIHQLFIRRYVEIVPKLRFNCNEIEDLPREQYEALKKVLFQTAIAHFHNNTSDKFNTFGYATLLLGRLVSTISWELAQNPDSSEKELEKSRVQRLINYIDENYRQKITLSMLAEMEGISSTHLSHFFRKAFGVSFQAYLSAQRLEKALVLMRDKTIPIVDICMNCGFSDSRYLEAACQKAFGCSVAEYRERIEAHGEIESLLDSGGLYTRCSRKESEDIVKAYLGQDYLKELCEGTMLQEN